MGDPSFEYEYIDEYLKDHRLVVCLDIWIIYKGIMLILRWRSLIMNRCSIIFGVDL